MGSPLRRRDLRYQLEAARHASMGDLGPAPGKGGGASVHARNAWRASQQAGGWGICADYRSEAIEPFSDPRIHSAWFAPSQQQEPTAWRLSRVWDRPCAEHAQHCEGRCTTSDPHRGLANNRAAGDARGWPIFVPTTFVLPPQVARSTASAEIDIAPPPRWSNPSHPNSAKLGRSCPQSGRNRGSGRVWQTPPRIDRKRGAKLCNPINSSIDSTTLGAILAGSGPVLGKCGLESNPVCIQRICAVSDMRRATAALLANKGAARVSFS